MNNAILKEIETIKKCSCKDCTVLFGHKKREIVYATELCALRVNDDWPDEVIKAIEVLKKYGITTEDYDEISLRKKGENER